MFDYAIKNNFFDDEDFLNLKNQLLNLEYTPPKKHDVERLYGHTYWHQRIVDTNSEVAEVIQKKVKKYFDFDIKKFNRIFYTMCGNQPTIHPHIDRTDDIQYQCLIYIGGLTDIYSGTGFFKIGNNVIENMKEGPQDIIGFKENKAIFWNSEMVHSPLHTENTGLWRYAIAAMFK